MSKLLSSKTIYEGKVINVYLERVENEGQTLTREVVRHRGGAAVLAERNGKFAFVRQYRHPFCDNFLEVPAGTRDGNEAGEETAFRELQEECGLKAKKLYHVCDYAVSPGYTDEVLHLFYANDFEEVNQNFDDDESLTVEWIDKEKCFEMALNGEFLDGKVMILLFWYMNRFEKN